MCLQYILGLLGDSNLVLPKNIAKFINGDVALPLQIFSWGWSFIICLYCGSDRFVDVRTTMQLPAGQMSLGDLDKLRKIMCVSLGLLLLATFFSFTSSKDFELEALSLGFVTSIVAYTSGNKFVKAFKFSGKDENKDGIPDEYEKEYYKWKRKQLKEGVDKEFITFDYFLDEYEETDKSEPEETVEEEPEYVSEPVPEVIRQTPKPKTKTKKRRK